MKRAVLALAIIAAGCSATENEPTTPEVRTSTSEGRTPPERVPGGVVLTSVGDLLGEYRVAGIDEKPVEGDAGIAVSIDGPMLSFEPTCVGFVWAIGFEGEVLALNRHGWPRSGETLAPGEPPSPPPPVCLVAVSQQQRELAAAFDSVTRAERTPENGLRFSGGGRSVLLFSQ